MKLKSNKCWLLTNCKPKTNIHTWKTILLLSVGFSDPCYKCGRHFFLKFAADHFLFRNSTLSLLLRIILWSILNVKILLNIEKKLAWNILVNKQNSDKMLEATAQSLTHHLCSIKFKCFPAKHIMFYTYLEHVFLSHVHTKTQIIA